MACPALALPSAEYCLITTFAVLLPLSMAPLSVAVPVWSPQQYRPSATYKYVGSCVGGCVGGCVGVSDEDGNGWS